MSGIYPATPPVGGAAAYLVPLGGVPQASGTGSPTIAFVSPPTSETAGTAFAVSGTVGPGGTAVQVGYSSSATVAPTSWTAATVTGTNWTVNLTVASAGTVYLWCQQTAAPSIQAVSAAVTVAGNSVTFTSPPTTATTSSATSVAGTVSPASTAVQVGWSTSNSTPPSSWTSMTVSGTGWTGSVTAPGTAGTYYLWAEQTANTGVYAVSAAVTVSAAGGTTLTSFGSTTFGVLNPSGGLAASYSAATYGAAAGGTAAQTIVWGLTNTPAASTSPADTFQNYWIPTSTAAYSSLPSSLPSSGEVGVTYGISANNGATNYNSGADVVAYLVVPNVPGTYRLVTFQLSSTGTIKAIAQTSTITITT